MRSRAVILPRRMLALYGRLAARVEGGLTAALEFFQPFLHRSLAHGGNASAHLGPLMASPPHGPRRPGEQRSW